MQIDELRQIVEQAWENRDMLSSDKTVTAIREVVSLLDGGTLRVAEPNGDDWKVNEWVKKAVILYFPIQNMELPMMGMKLNNPHLSGFVLELNSNHEGQSMTMKVVKVSNKSLIINSSDYKKAGF